MITEEEIKQLGKIAEKEPVVAKLLEEYGEFISNPEEVFRNELAQTAIYLARELRDARNSTILKGEDKTFERVSVLLKEGERILGGISRTTTTEDKIAVKKGEKHKGKALI